MRTLIAVGLAISIPAVALGKDAKPSDPNKKICREQGQTGSLFTKRVCYTAAEWAKVDERTTKDAKAYDDYRRDNSGFRR